MIKDHQCKHCGELFSNRANNFIRHEARCKGYKPVAGQCKHCNEIFSLEDKPLGWMANHSRWCLLNPSRPQKKTEQKSDKTSRKHSEETRKKLSDARKKFLRENPDKHPWKRKDKFISRPCEFFKKYLSDNNIKFVEEFLVSSERFYSIDVAFPDRKIGIEINGNQHYDSNGNLKSYYQERHDFLVSLGWQIFEIHYTAAYKPEDIIINVDLGNQPDYSRYLTNKKDKVNLTKEERLLLEKEKYLEKNKPVVELLINSGIDFSKFGWRSKAAEIIGIKTQKVAGWMERNLPDFYKTCHKR